jgi:hypothetical protein
MAAMLKSYAITLKTGEVFRYPSKDVDALVCAAKELTEFLDALIREICEVKTLHKIPYATMKQFARIWYEFLRAYHEWYVKDKKRIVNSLHWRLMLAYQTIKRFPLGDSVFRATFDEQIKKLRDQLLKIGGPVALKSLDDRRFAEPPGCHPFLFFRDNSYDEGDFGGSKIVLNEKLTNEQVAHELLIDPTFEMPEETVFTQAQSMENYERSCKYFWDTLTKEMEEKKYQTAKKVLDIIQVSIQHSNPSLGGILNQDVINELLQDEKTLFWPDVCKLVLGIMEIIEEIQRPSRKDETSELFAPIEAAMMVGMMTGHHQHNNTHITEFANALETLLKRVKVLTIDDANAKLRTQQPIICQAAPDCLRGKFKEALRTGTTTLDGTKIWIEGVVKNQPPGTPRAIIITTAMTQFVTAATTIIKFPETLERDAHRLHQCKQMWHYIIGSLTLLARLSNVVPKTHTYQLNALAGELGSTKSTIKKTVESIFFQSAPLLPISTQNKIQYAMQDALNHEEDPVGQLMEARFGFILTETIKAGGIVPPNLQIPANFHHIMPLIADLSSKIKLIISVSELVYGPFYDKIIEDYAATSGHQAANVSSC